MCRPMAADSSARLCFNHQSGMCAYARDVRNPGETGRYIQDDPQKYPNKENMGPFGQSACTTYTQPIICALHFNDLESWTLQ